MQGASAPPSAGNSSAPAPVRAAAPYVRPSGERAKLVLAIIGLALTSLIGLLILGYLGPFIQTLYNLWGLFGLLLLFGGLVAFFLAFLVYLLRGKRAEPHYEAPATMDSLQTKQS